MVTVGERADDFTLPDTAHGEVRLSDTLAEGPTVLLFLRGHWCSYCAEQLRTYSALSYDMWRHQNVDVLPIAGDSIPKLVEMRDRFELTLQLLSDPSLEVTEQYTRTESRAGTDDDRERIPVATTVVVDTDQTVRYKQVAETPADRAYANYVRHLIRDGFDEPYAGD